MGVWAETRQSCTSIIAENESVVDIEYYVELLSKVRIHKPLEPFLSDCFVHKHRPCFLHRNAQHLRERLNSFSCRIQH